MFGLSKSAERLQTAFTRHVAGKRLSPTTRASIEEALLEADLGYESAQEIAASLSARGFRDPDSLEEVQTALRELIEKKLRSCEIEESTLFDKKGLLVVVLLGLNGCGKTSIAGKLAARFKAQGASVLLAAGDTFRAAATEQLREWAARSDTEIITAERHSDPAALAFNALAKAQEKTKEEFCDILILDTAGRQHSDANLMQQLAKIERALMKQVSATQAATMTKETTKDTTTNSPPRIEFWLVLDATLGQTLRSQVKQFAAVVPVRKLLLTKLDSSARAGALIALAQEEKPIPVQYLSAGESLSDIEPFRAKAFAEGLVNLLPAA